MSEMIARRLASRALTIPAACALACITALAALSAPAALAGTSVGVLPVVLPYRLGAHATAAVSLHFYGGANGVPAPLRGAVLRLPAGLGVDLSNVASCPIARLRSRGGAGCPSASLLGRGAATLKVHAGSQTLPERATVSIFRGLNRGGDPTFEILGRGETPLQETTISTAVLLPDSSPYGSKLVVTVPPIPTLRYEPDASFSSLSLTIGGTSSARNPIVLPRRCPRSGFAFAASFSFADGSTASESGRVPCP